MTDQLAAPAPAEPVPPADRSVRLRRTLVLGAAFFCAACGLVYELALIALGSYLIGDSVGQASIVISVMVFAMGLGSLAAKPLVARPAHAFVLVELALGAIGGLSVLTLYAAYAWLDLYTPALVVMALLVGALIGAEIPLLMTFVQRIRAQAAATAAADLFAADYLGALIGGLAFPFLLLPWLGQIRGALAVGIGNVVVGAGMVLWLFRGDLGRWARRWLTLAAAAVVAVLVATMALSTRFEVTARQALFQAPVVHAERSAYQDIVLTRSLGLRGVPDLRLFLNGDLQFSSLDEYRYHEALVHPVLAGPHERVLILGGGDGLALREVLHHPGVREAVQVELDPAMIRLSREEPLRSVNAGATADPRARVVTADAFPWLRANTERFDAVIVDMPDADSTATAKLYSLEFYGLARRALAPGGRLVVQAGSPYFAREAFWCVEATLREAGLATVPYHVDVPSFGDWGFVLAAEQAPALRLAGDVPPLRFLNPAVLAAAAVFPPDRGQLPVQYSTLMEPTMLAYSRRAWQGY